MARAGRKKRDEVVWVACAGLGLGLGLGLTDQAPRAGDTYEGVSP